MIRRRTPALTACLLVGLIAACSGRVNETSSASAPAHGGTESAGAAPSNGGALALPIGGSGNAVSTSSGGALDAVAGAGGASGEAGAGGSAGMAGAPCVQGSMVKVDCNWCECLGNGQLLCPTVGCLKPCGGILGDTCGANEYCSYLPGALCGAADATAFCQTRPPSCDVEDSPVCGCDGKTYPSFCDAAMHGLGIYANGACDNSAAP